MGVTNYKKSSGLKSAWCAAGGDTAVEPGDAYPNNLSSEIIYGPFDLSDVNYGVLSFSYWIDTEYEKDWFFYKVSVDGINFSGIGISGYNGVSGSGSWEDESLSFSSIPHLENITGNPQVWIAFSFVSDSIYSNDKGVYIDNIFIKKGNVPGTPIVGAINGKLIPEKSPYIVMEDIGIVDDDSLVIEPGVIIKFEKEKKFIINGYLYAKGTENDSIYFISNESIPKVEDWGGIIFYYPTDGSILDYTCIKYAGSRINNRSTPAIIADGDIIISNSKITKNIGAILISGNVNSISNNSISHNRGYAILTSMLADANITYNEIYNNSTGITLNYSHSFVSKNRIYNNSAYGISINELNAVISENDIRNNGSGIEITGHAFLSTNPTIIKNVIMDNQRNGIFMDGSASRAYILNNLIKGNAENGIDFSQISDIWTSPGVKVLSNTIVSNDKSGIYCGNKYIDRAKIMNNIVAHNKNSGISCKNSNMFSISFNDFYDNSINFDLSEPDSIGIISCLNNNNDPCDKYYNIFVPPNFNDEMAEDYSLKNNSQCINAGNPNIFFNDTDGSSSDLGFTGGSQLDINHTLDFGQIIVETSKSLNITFHNFRDSAIVLNNFSLSDSVNFILVTQNVDTIPSYDYKSLEISFNPISKGLHTSMLSVISDAFIGINDANISLQGTGITGTLVSGTVSGIWTKLASPYILTTSITIPDGQELKIEPGVKVWVEGNYTILVKGKLEAIGVPNDSITITGHNFIKDDEGPYLFYISSLDTTTLKYCIVEKTPVYANIFNPINPLSIIVHPNSKMILSNSRISNNKRSAIEIRESFACITNCIIENNDGVGINFINSRGMILNCLIKNNDGEAIYLTDSHLEIKNNFIYNNKGGIRSLSGHLLATNNIITNNNGLLLGGMYTSNDTLNLINNVIYKNSSSKRENAWLVCGGLRIGKINELFVFNNIIMDNKDWYEKKEINKEGISSIMFCNIKGGYKSKGNIDIDPLFIDPENLDFQLQVDSPCIDAGHDSTLYNDPENPFNTGFALYPALGTIRNDMGAYGGPGVANCPVNQVPHSFSLLTPTNGDTIQTLTPTFEWENSIDPDFGDHVYYNFYLDESQNFSSPIIISDLITTNHSLPDTLESASTYYWKVIAYDNDSLTTLCNEVFSFSTSSITSINQKGNNIPEVFDLSQNYPNPFNPTTAIKYQLPNDCHVVLKIYNMLGQEIITLIDKDQKAGYYEIQWNAFRNASGLYFYYLKAETNNNKSYEKINKMLLLK